MESVFTITSIDDCFRIGDINRRWEPADIIGKYLIPISGTKTGVIYNIAGFSNGVYTVAVKSDDWDDISWDSDIWTKRTNTLNHTIDSNGLKICKVNTGNTLNMHAKR